MREQFIARRSRYYQAEMDVAALKPGEPFENLPDSFVIFICTFDPFGRGRYCYTFREVCDEDGEPLGDGTVKIFLSTKGRNTDEVSEELVHFLGYFVESTDKCVQDLKRKLISRSLTGGLNSLQSQNPLMLLLSRCNLNIYYSMVTDDGCQS